MGRNGKIAGVQMDTTTVKPRVKWPIVAVAEVNAHTLTLRTQYGLPSDEELTGPKRGGEDLNGEKMKLRAGDTLLLSGSSEILEWHTAGSHVVAVDPPAQLRRGAPLGRGAKRAIGLLLAIVVLTMVLGQLISNTATELIVAPVAVAVSVDIGTSVLPFMMALAVAGAASFLTPVATPANTMVMEPGGYRFGDYWKLGLPLMVLYLLVAVFWVPVWLPF